MTKILNYTVWTLIGALLIYTRLLNIDWGLPYPFHPDERNMANAIEQLSCHSLTISNFLSGNISHKDCFNPHFFAYGQLPIYLSYIFVMVYKAISNSSTPIISFNEATIALRTISVLSSFITIYILIQSLKMYLEYSKIKLSNVKLQILTLPFVFSPFFIQFSHFGTTESLLMLLYTCIFYLSLLKLSKDMDASRYLFYCALISGLSIGIKTSSLIFLSIPMIVGFVFPLKKEIKNNGIPEGVFQTFFSLVKFALLSIVVMVITSPHTILSFPDFLSSMRYESAVALGDIRVFYTRQFDQTIPIYFQAFKIFPYALGSAVWLYFLAGFLLLPFNKIHNLLRLSIILFFFPTAFMYAKWTRFLAPIFPIMLLTSILFIVHIYALIRHLLYAKRSLVKELIRYGNPAALYILVIIFCIPGVAYLSIYTDKDVRFVASKWIYNNIPDNSYILSETANVVDIPIHDPEEVIPEPATNYQYNSLYFYDIDENIELQNNLSSHLMQADYIFVPSRRVFANHTCMTPAQISDVNSLILLTHIETKRCQYLKNKYPKLNTYYNELFTQRDFEKVAEFTSYPHINFFGKSVIEFKDENAEETWTVFDHPVIRIYKRKI